MIGTLIGTDIRTVYYVHIAAKRCRHHLWHLRLSITDKLSVNMPGLTSIRSVFQESYKHFQHFPSSGQYQTAHLSSAVTSLMIWSELYLFNLVPDPRPKVHMHSHWSRSARHPGQCQQIYSPSLKTMTQELQSLDIQSRARRFGQSELYISKYLKTYHSIQLWQYDIAFQAGSLQIVQYAAEASAAASYSTCWSEQRSSVDIKQVRLCKPP